MYILVLKNLVVAAIRLGRVRARLLDEILRLLQIAASDSHHNCAAEGIPVTSSASPAVCT